METLAINEYRFLQPQPYSQENKHPQALALLTFGQNREVQHYPKALLVRVVQLSKQKHLGSVESWVAGFAPLPQRVVLVRYESPAYFVPLPEGWV